VPYGLERARQRDHDRRRDGRPLELPCGERLEHPCRGRQARVEQLLGLLLAAVEAQPCGGAEHRQQRGAGAGEQQCANRHGRAWLRAHRARPLALSA